MYFFLLFSRARGLTTNQIADCFEQTDEFDDSDADKDYKPEGEDSSSESEEEELSAEAAAKNNRAVIHDVPDILVHMDPPQERADADTDKDSGKRTFYFITGRNMQFVSEKN